MNKYNYKNDLRDIAKYIDIDSKATNWHFITVYDSHYNILKVMEYIYYNKRESIKIFREKYNLKYKKLESRY